MWAYHRSVFDWNNYMLKVPLPPNVVRLFHAAARDPRIATDFASNFAEPERNWNLLASSARTDAYLRRRGIDPERWSPNPPPGMAAETGPVTASHL